MDTQAQPDPVPAALCQRPVLGLRACQLDALTAQIGCVCRWPPLAPTSTISAGVLAPARYATCSYRELRTASRDVPIAAHGHASNAAPTLCEVRANPPAATAKVHVCARGGQLNEGDDRRDGAQEVAVEERQRGLEGAMKVRTAT